MASRSGQMKKDRDYLSSEARIQMAMLELFSGSKSRSTTIRKNYYKDNSPVQQHIIVKREAV